MHCCLLLLILPHLTNQVYFKKLFADAGVAIHCPSDNKVYIHPISGDLQQCSQQLGNYNESSCPDGTVCERFPILIPGFQDYCCWADGQTTDSENLVIGTTTEIPDELVPFTEPPSIPPMRKLVVTAAPEKPDDEDNNGNMSEEDYEDITTKRPRNRKTTTTTTTESPTTITKKPSNRRLPRCQNPDDMPLIDFGNRLRDCYYQQCNRGYRCEFNKDIRRFICCGQAALIVPPAGLPMIPNPKPLIPRPIRRGPFNFNDGDDEDSNGCPYESQNGCKMKKTGHADNNQNTEDSRSNNWSENGCPFGKRTINGCPYGPPNHNGIQDGCSGNTIQGCGLKNGWGTNYGNNIEHQQLPPPRSLPEPESLQPTKEASQPQEGKGGGGSNWNDYDNPYESASRNGNRERYGNSGYENNQIQIPPTGSWNSGVEGNWNEGGYNNNNHWNNKGNWKESDGQAEWDGRNDGSKWESSNIKWNGSPSPKESSWGNQQGFSQSNNWENTNWNGSPPPTQQGRTWNENRELPQQNSNWEEPNGNWNGPSRNGWNGEPSSPSSNTDSNRNDSPSLSQSPQNRNGPNNNNWEHEWKQQNNWVGNSNNIGNEMSQGNTETTSNRGEPKGGNNNYENYGNFHKKKWDSESSTNQPSGPYPMTLTNTISNKRSKPTETCSRGSEFRQQYSAPKCTPPGSDSCPLSHPRCIPSSSLGHHVCCL